MTSLVNQGRAPRRFAHTMLIAALAQELSDRAAPSRIAARYAAMWIAEARSRVVGAVNAQLADSKTRG